jgi:hypothetical protein
LRQDWAPISQSGNHIVRLAVEIPRFLDIPSLANSHADALKAVGHAVEKADAVRQAGPNLGYGERWERRNECAEAPFRLVLPPREGKARYEKSIDPDGLGLLDESTPIPVNSLLITVGFKMRGGDANGGKEN